MRTIVESSRSQIEDLSVTFSYIAIKDDPDNQLLYRSRMKVVVKGSKLYYDDAYGPDPAKDKTSFGRELAFNGVRTTNFMKHMATASVSIERGAQAETRGLGFFDIALYNPAERGFGDDMSLHALLDRPRLRLRPETEKVGGHDCEVVESIDPKSDRASETVWLDVDRGLIPVRHIYTAPPDYATVLMESRIEQAVQLSPGLWFPLIGRKKLHAVKPYSNYECEWVMRVERNPDGTWVIALNQNVSDDLFDLWKHLPPGTMLVDAQTHASTTVGGNDYERLSSNYELPIKSATFTVPERPNSLAPAPHSLPVAASMSTTHYRYYTFIGIVLVAVGAALILFRTKRWRNAHAD
ncbi:MAG TPA: hypothetical protein VFC78_14065 [Tepidisphaeraceae bacterium]|nr:hypothetical protein [Tepidisphaeraceae bacterium]